MEQIEGFNLAKGKDFACKLKKALYGLKQAPRPWYARLDHNLEQQGFKKGVVGSNLYIKMNEDKLLVTLVYVDDLILASNNDEMSHELNQHSSLELLSLHSLDLRWDFDEIIFLLLGCWKVPQHSFSHYS